MLRKRYARLQSPSTTQLTCEQPVDGQEVSEDQSGEESLMDMISSFGQQADAKTKGDAASATIEEPKKAIKGKSGKK